MEMFVRRNPFDTSDLQALRQAMEPMQEPIKVISNVVNRYNDKGRPETKTEFRTMMGVIQPYGDFDINRKNGGEQGEWLPVKYLLTIIDPDYVRRGEIIEHPILGKLRVVSIKPKKRYGTMSAILEDTASSPDIRDRGELY